MWALTASLVVLGVFLRRWRHSGQSLVDFSGLGFVYLYTRLLHRWSSTGPAPLPARGPVLLVSNHTCSADPAFVTAGLSRRLCFMVAAEYYGPQLLRRLFDWLGCVPATRNGRDVRAVREGLRR